MRFENSLGGRLTRCDQLIDLGKMKEQEVSRAYSGWRLVVCVEQRLLEEEHIEGRLETLGSFWTYQMCHVF